jgi:hypothetical protein
MVSSRQRSINTSLNQYRNVMASDPQSNRPNQLSRQNGSDESAPPMYRGKMRKIENSSDIPERRAQRTEVLRKRKSFASFARFANVASRIVSRVRKTEYVYSALTDPDDIRLLVIRPSEKTSHPLYCELVLSTNMPDPPHPYEALSYMWGNEDATEEIKIFYPTLSGVFIAAGPHPRRTLMGRLWASFYIRPNLYAALLHLRNKKKNIVVWVDALCIDQTNLMERSEQVTKMADIYNRATNVCVWLGSGNLRSQLALQFIPKLLQNTDLVKDDSSSSHWSALAELMRNQWFSRRYVRIALRASSKQS